MRVVLGALAGAVAAFITAAVLHMATPVGRAGISSFSNMQAACDALRAAAPQSGLYLFGGDPYGLLVITHGLKSVMSPVNLGIEFLTTFLAALIVAILLARIEGSYLSRAALGVLLPLFGLFSVTASHWNFYKFPAAFILGQFATDLLAWFVASLVMAKIVKAARPG
jgi:hypothetical protein